MLIRNLLQDTVGDIRIRKRLETSQTQSGLGFVVRHNKKETSQITFHNPGPAGRVLQQTERNVKPSRQDSTVTSGGLN